MELLIKTNTKNDIQLPSININNGYKKTKSIEILPINSYLSEQKPFSAPVSSSPPNEFLSNLKKRMNNYF